MQQLSQNEHLIHSLSIKSQQQILKKKNYNLTNQVNALLREKERLIIQNLKYQENVIYLRLQLSNYSQELSYLKTKLKQIQQKLKEEINLNIKLRSQLNVKSGKITKTQSFSHFKKQSQQTLSCQKQIKINFQKEQLYKQIKILRENLFIEKKQSQQIINQLNQRVQEHQTMIHQMQQIILDKDNQIQSLIRYKNKQQNISAQRQQSFSFCQVKDEQKKLNCKHKLQISQQNTIQLERQLKQYKLKSCQIQSSFKIIQSKFSQLQQTQNKQEIIIKQLKSINEKLQIQYKCIKQQNIQICKQLEQNQAKISIYSSFQDKYQDMLHECEQIKYKYQKEIIQLNSLRQENQILKNFNQKYEKIQYQQKKADLKQNLYQQLNKSLKKEKDYQFLKKQQIVKKKGQILQLLQQIQSKQQQNKFYKENDLNNQQIIKALQKQLESRINLNCQNLLSKFQIQSQIQQSKTKTQNQYQIYSNQQEIKSVQLFLKKKIKESLNQMQQKYKLQKEKQQTQQLNLHTQIQRSKGYSIDLQEKYQKTIKTISQLQEAIAKLKKEKGNQLTQLEKRHLNQKQLIQYKVQQSIQKMQIKIQNMQVTYQDQIASLNQILKQRNEEIQKLKQEFQIVSKKSIQSRSVEKKNQNQIKVNLQTCIIQQKQQAYQQNLYFQRLIQEKQKELLQQKQSNLVKNNQIQNFKKILNEKNAQLFQISKTIVQKQNVERQLNLKNGKITQLSDNIILCKIKQSEFQARIKMQQYNFLQQQRQLLFWKQKYQYYKEDFQRKCQQIKYLTQNNLNQESKLQQLFLIITSLKNQINAKKIFIIQCKKQQNSLEQCLNQRTKQFQLQIRKYQSKIQEYQELLMWNIKKNEQKQSQQRKTQLKNINLKIECSVCQMMIFPQSATFFKRKLQQKRQNEQLQYRSKELKKQLQYGSKRWNQQLSQIISKRNFQRVEKINFQTQNSKIINTEYQISNIQEPLQKFKIQKQNNNLLNSKHLETYKPTRQFQKMDSKSILLSTKFQKIKKFDTKELDSKIKNIKDANDLLKKK